MFAKKSGFSKIMVGDSLSVIQSVYGAGCPIILQGLILDICELAKDF